MDNFETVTQLKKKTFEYWRCTKKQQKMSKGKKGRKGERMGRENLKPYKISRKEVEVISEINSKRKEKQEEQQEDNGDIKVVFVKQTQGNLSDEGEVTEVDQSNDLVHFLEAGVSYGSN